MFSTQGGEREKNTNIVVCPSFYSMALSWREHEVRAMILLASRKASVPMLPTGVLGPLSSRNLSEARQEIQVNLTRAPAAAWGSQNTQVPFRLACSLKWGASLFLIWGEGRGVFRSQPGGVA